ncbi:MAG: hypothetical protein ACOYMG_14280, partial [Candidatus Methylumidiphilus sp.]
MNTNYFTAKAHCAGTSGCHLLITYRFSVGAGHARELMWRRHKLSRPWSTPTDILTRSQAPAWECGLGSSSFQ